MSDISSFLTEMSSIRIPLDIDRNIHSCFMLEQEWIEFQFVKIETKIRA